MAINAFSLVLTQYSNINLDENTLTDGDNYMG